MLKLPKELKTLGCRPVCIPFKPAEALLKAFQVDGGDFVCMRLHDCCFRVSRM